MRIRYIFLFLKILWFEIEVLKINSHLMFEYYIVHCLVIFYRVSYDISKATESNSTNQLAQFLMNIILFIGIHWLAIIERFIVQIAITFI